MPAQESMAAGEHNSVWCQVLHERVVLRRVGRRYFNRHNHGELNRARVHNNVEESWVAELPVRLC